MAMRVMARRFVAQVESSSLRSTIMRQTRFRSDKGILSEEEKAAENIFIRMKVEWYLDENPILPYGACRGKSVLIAKREQEMKEKLARKVHQEAATPPPKTETPHATSESGYRNTAIVAGIVAAAAAYWLLYGSSKKQEKEQ